jgi:hypothetical protein
LVILCAPDRLSAQEIPPSAGTLFLLLPVGAQAVAMGQTAVAIEGRGEAAFWNPAGLATLDRNEVAFNTATLTAASTHVLTAYFPSHAFGVLGGSIYLVDYGALDRTDSSSNTIAHVSPRNLEFLASYAAEVAGLFTVGVNYKVMEFLVECSGDCTGMLPSRAVTHALDVGGQVAVGPSGALRVGVAVRNVGLKASATSRDPTEPLPARLVVGALYRITLPGTSGLAGDDRLDVRVAADLDRPWTGYGDSQMRLGVDLGYQRLVRLRGGYAFVRDGLSGPSVGMGVTSGAIGVDLARTFLTGSDLVAQNPTFFSFRVAF